MKIEKITHKPHTNIYSNSLSEKNTKQPLNGLIYNHKSASAGDHAVFFLTLLLRYERTQGAKKI